MKNYFRLFLITVLSVFSLFACQNSEPKSIKIAPTEKVEIKTEIQDTIYESESTYNHTTSNQTNRNIGFGIFALGMLGMATQSKFKLKNIFEYLNYLWVIQFIFDMFSGVSLNKDGLRKLADNFRSLYGEVNLTPENLEAVNELLPLIKVGGGIDTIRDMYVRANEDGVLSQMELIHSKIVDLGGYDDLLKFLSEAQNIVIEEKKKTL